MNVKFVDRIPMHLPVIQKVFERAYGYYTAGVRMYLVLIPMFAWLVSCWLLMAITLPHIYLVHSYDDMSFIDEEVREMYSAYQPLLPSHEGGGEGEEEGVELKPTTPSALNGKSLSTLGGAPRGGAVAEIV
jgi:hypothetical protein